MTPFHPHLLLATFLCLTCHIHLTHATAALNRDNLNVPCGYLDSLNITNGHLDPTTKSISYDNQTFLPGQYGSFDYEISYEKRLPAQKHYRACVCKTKPCISMCCPLGQSFISINGTFVCTPNPHPGKLQMIMNVKDPKTNTTKEMNMLSSFGYVLSQKCDRYVLEPENTEADEFEVMTVRLSA